MTLKPIATITGKVANQPELSGFPTPKENNDEKIKPINKLIFKFFIDKQISLTDTNITTFKHV